MTADTAASVRARLWNLARARGEDFQLTLLRFAAERFLYRLGRSPARRRCLLKGAAMLSVWLPDPYRATRDIDLLALGRVDDGAIRALIAEICAVSCPEDGLQFDLSDLRVETIRADEEYSGKRVRFRALLGRVRIPVQVDLGVGDAVTVEPEEISYPVLLDSLPAPSLRAYSREQSVAEKLEAMVTLGARTSRMKDFHDVWALAGAFPFDGPALRDAVAACFQRRGTPWTPHIPEPLTLTFYRTALLEERWRHYLAAGAILEPPPQRFDQIGERIIRFLGPVRESILAESEFSRSWNPGGPWQ